MKPKEKEPAHVIIHGDTRMEITKEQKEAYDRLRDRMGAPVSICPLFDGSGCLMVQYPSITIGIETDGYTHS